MIEFILGLSDGIKDAILDIGPFALLGLWMVFFNIVFFTLLKVNNDRKNNND